MLAIAGGFALLLGVAAWGKLRDMGAFRAVAADYKLVPASLLGPAAYAVPALEGALAVAWLAGPWRDEAAVFAGIGTAVLMIGYGSAIAANLVRGRTWIDCGCGGGEQLSWALVARNAILALLSFAPVAVLDSRPPDWADAAVSVPVLAVAALLYFATGALLDNNAAMRIWREAD